jgi:hypothetical protein
MTLVVVAGCVSVCDRSRTALKIAGLNSAVISVLCVCACRTALRSLSRSRASLQEQHSPHW